MSLSEYGLKNGEGIVASKTEEEVYKALGETFRSPAQR
jgi:DNA polymerase/3'-5' exonuclease PolX